MAMASACSVLVFKGWATVAITASNVTAAISPSFASPTKTAVAFATSVESASAGAARTGEIGIKVADT